jgi:pimeloyl-ACP methyl ester carboxylesterase
MVMEPFALERLELHGHSVAFRRGGTGEAVLFVHGMAGSATTWRYVMPALAEDFTVLAPDLPGHGSSDKGRGDYSLGALANALRDLLVALGHDRVTIVGQSLGGGVALQFAYQFPERCARLVLVSSGGLGEEVSPLLRVLAFPGAQFVLPIVCTRWVHDAGDGIASAFRRVGLRPSPELAEVWQAYGSLADDDARAAFVHTLQSVVDGSGQRVSALDRLYLAAALPTLIMWGDRDRIIPVAQAHATHAAIAGSRLEVFEGAGHFPHCEDPARFVAVFADFMRTTAPASLSATTWETLLHGRSAAS